MTVNFSGNGGLGAAGTKVIKSLGPTEEIWTYVWQSVVGSVAIDVALTLVLVGCLIAGWWAFSIFLGLVGFLISVIVLTFWWPEKLLWQIVFGNAWALAFFIGLGVGYKWRAMLLTGLRLVWKQIAVIGSFEWPVYVAAAAVLVLAWAKVGWKVMVAIGAIAAVACVVLFSDGREWAAAWDNLKYLLIPYSWPVIGFALLLGLVMAKEMLFPSLEWTFDPVKLEELREVGLIGLWLPRLFGGSKENEPEQEPELPVVRAEHRDDTGNGVKERYARLPSDGRSRDFYKAIHAGKPFTISTARQCKVGRRTFENRIRKVFLERGWLHWKDEQHHDQGLELTKAGSEMIGELALNDPRG